MSAGRSGTDSSAAEYHHQFRTLREWFDDLCLVLQKLGEAPWARIARIDTRSLSAAGSDLVRLRWRMSILELEACRLRFADPPDIEGLRESLLCGCECVERVHTAIEAYCTGWKWHLALKSRRLLGVLGIRARGFRTPQDDARDTITLFREWRRTVFGPRLSAPDKSSSHEGCAPNSSHPRTFYEDYVEQASERAKPPFWTEFRQANDRAIEACLSQSDSHPSQPIVSIIMPAFNRASIIGDAIRTILDQTYRNWELLVCDDGSQDDTEAVVNTFYDPRIVYLRLPHAGAATARNAGLERARGDYIAYLDTDNLWHPQFLEVMTAHLEQTSGSQCAHGLYLEENEGQDGRVSLEPGRGGTANYGKLAQRNWMDLNTFVHRRSLYLAIGGFTDGLPRLQDWDLFLKYCFARPPLRVNAVLALYRRRASWNQLTTAARDADTQAVRTVRENVARYYAEGPLRASTPARSRNVTIVAPTEPTDAFLKSRNLASALQRSGYGVQLILADTGNQASNMEWGNSDVPTLTVPIPTAYSQEKGSVLQKTATRVEGDLLYSIGDNWAVREMTIHVGRQKGVPVVLEIPDRAADEDPFVGRESVPVVHSHMFDRLSGNRCFLLRHMVDENVFDPGKYDRDKSRQSFSCNPGERLLVLFTEGGCLDDSDRAFCRNLPEYRILAPCWAKAPSGAAQTEEMPNLTVVPLNKPDELATLLKACDAAIFRTDPDQPRARLHLPYALGAAMAMQTPILATPIGEMADLAWQGYCLALEEDFRGQIDALLGNSDSVRVMTTSATRLFVREFSYRAAALQFHFIYEFAVAHKKDSSIA